MITKIVHALFWFFLGGFVSIQLIVHFVLSPRATKVGTSAGLAVYNLFDHILPFTLVFGIMAVVFLIIMVVLKFLLH